MQANGEEARAGTALLMAAAPPGKTRLIDATAALPALSAVPAYALTGTAAGNVVQLADPTDPQAVLTQLRTLARASGPLTLYLIGQLHLDRKQSQPHIALAHTTPATVRYTALPWQWLTDELRLRPPGHTAVFVDLVADETAWERLAGRPPALCPGVGLYGTVAPPPSRRRPATPAYAKALATLLRTVSARPPLAELHHYAVQRAELPQNALRFEPAANTPTASSRALPSARSGEPAATSAVTVPDPHPAILDAARAGRHTEAASMAAAWEQYALRSYGQGSPEAIHWVEVRADLARLADDPARSCELWLIAATARLQAGQSPDTPDVEAAVDRAHHQWEQIRDAARARALTPRLFPLRSHVPGRRPGALSALQRKADELSTA